jgi:Ca2+-binding EF-hand superfamily protein
MATRILGRLKDRGIHGIRTFRIMLHNMDLTDDGQVMGRTFEGALAHMGVRLKYAEYDQLIALFGQQGQEDCDTLIDYVYFLACGASNWSTQREEVVREAYDCLREMCPGGILTLSIIQTELKPQALTSDLVPNLVEHHSDQEFLAQWNASLIGPDGVVAWTDFLDYYLDVCLWFDCDATFCKFVCKCWGIDMDDWLAKKVFHRYATGEDEDTLPVQDFIRMLAELDPTINADEAMAWYEAIDEDDSGEVSLDEFLESKILKVKRLFDEFDVGSTRTVGAAEMPAILQSLSNAITEQEAKALYQYCDKDGTGEVSFNEFLENHLLKMLQIFDEFCHDRRHSFNEAQMKQLLRKLDPYLDDYDIHQIYKAIDSDGGGSVSFIEFVESHVLRAKILFDRYDTDRGRTLSQFKFRELMLDVDESLTSSQMEAIYNLVADHNTGKVHLGGFLNPNIVKLKLLFDKYDQDGSRYLDYTEFNKMLKELFRNTPERDIDVLQAELCPPGTDQGITFTDYIQRFKEIQRHHDLMQLAKRRLARERALAKGLIYREAD